MNRAIVIHIIRFLVVVLLQVLVLRRATLAWDDFPYVQILMYPVFIMLLPLRMQPIYVILWAFALGMAVDVFYNSPGVHASASLFTAFIRMGILRQLAPRGGYTATHNPNKAALGWEWFLRYAAILLTCHLFFYFSVEYFTFVYILQILLKTIGSFIASMIFIIMFVAVFNPKE
jgi:hypothetical protein